MEQLAFPFVETFTPKQFNIHAKIPIKRMKKGYTLVHVSLQANFDVQENDVLNVTSSDRYLKVGQGIVKKVWRGRLGDFPASWLVNHESDSQIITYWDLVCYLFPYSTSNKDDAEITAVMYYSNS